MRNIWWWVIGGGALLWVVNKSKAETPVRIEGGLTVAIAWKPGKNTPAAVDVAMRSLEALTGCGGPELMYIQGNTSTKGAVASSNYLAVWTHNKMGPIKESVRACTLKALQKFDANIVDFQATRVS